MGERVYNDFLGHAFRDNRHVDLNLTIEQMAFKGFDLVYKNLSKLKPGDNALIPSINDITKPFKAFVKDGKV